MSPLEALSQSIPAHQTAGRFGVEVVGLLRPMGAAAGSEGVRLCPLADLARPLDLEALFQKSAPEHLSQSVLRDHVLVVRPAGKFFSTDKLALTQVRSAEEEWAIDLVVINVEDQDGEAAPRDLYVILRIDAGNRRLRRVLLQFSRRQRDFRGNETASAEPAPRPERIEFSD